VTDVITDIESVDDAPHEPGRCGGEDGHPGRTGAPLAPIELVDPIAGLLAEQFGYTAIPPRHDVNGQMRCVLGDSISVVAP
jgi:hypothetical protein